MTVFSLWENRVRQIHLGKLFQSTRDTCPACGREAIERMFERPAGVTARALCGRTAVQVTDSSFDGVDLSQAAERFPHEFEIKVSRFVVRMRLDGFPVSLFADGRVIVDGTEDVELAKKVFERVKGLAAGPE